MSILLKNKLILMLILLYENNLTHAQSLNLTLLRQLIQANEDVLGLQDSSLLKQSRYIRVFNLTNMPADGQLLNAINPVNGLYSMSYKNGYIIYLIPDNKLVADTNTGKYRDMFIVRFDSKNRQHFSIATLSYKFKPNDCLNQNQILGEFDFELVNGSYVLKAHHLDAAD